MSSVENYMRNRRSGAVSEAGRRHRTVSSLPPAPAPTDSERVMTDDVLEQSVLSMLCNEPKLLVDAQVTASDFAMPRSKAVYGALERVLDKGQVPDAVTLWEELQTMNAAGAVGDANELHDFITLKNTGADVVSSLSTYVDMLKTRASYAHQMRVANYLARRVSEGAARRDPAEQLQELFEKAAAAALNGGPKREDEEESLADTGQRLMDYYENGDDTKRIPIGISSLDRALGGGFLPGKVVTIGANSGYGKSVMGIQIALSAALNQQVRTVFYSLEMPREEVLHRANAAMCQIPFEVLSHNRANPQPHIRLLEDYEIAHLKSNTGRLVSGDNLVIQDTPRLSLPQLRTFLTRAQQEGRPFKVVVLDYLAQLEADKRIDDERQRINAIMEDLKRIAKQYDVTVVLLAQTQRNMEEGPVTDANMNALRGSGGIENASDVVLLLGKVDSVEYPEAELRPECYRAVKIVKNRMGQPGIVRNLMFEGAYQRFSDPGAPLSARLKAVGSEIPVTEVIKKDADDAILSMSDMNDLSEAVENLGGDAIDAPEYAPRHPAW